MDKNVYLYDATNDVLTPAVEPGAVIQNSDGTSMPRRKNLRFVNANVEDDVDNDVTVVTTSGWFVGDVSNFGANYAGGTKKVTLHWSDPDDVVIEGAVQAAWGGTVIVRKEGSVPSSNGDGVVIVNNTARNQYATNGFEDTTIEYDTTYYYRAFPYTTKGLYTNGSNVSAEVPGEITLFGAEWDGTASSAWTRTDGAAEFEDPNPYYVGMEGTPSSPFDDIMPWSGMQVVEDSEAGTLVSIPKFWYKITPNSDGLKIQISSERQDGFLVSPAHADRGDGNGERDVVYIGKYKCDSSNTYKSRTNCSASAPDTTLQPVFNAIHNLGNGIWVEDYAMYWTIAMLYLVEYADWNSQEKIGYGGANLLTDNTGMCDNLPYHTGTNTSSRSTYGHTLYRGIEDLWGNGRECLNGIYVTTGNSGSKEIFCNNDPSRYISGGVSICTYPGVLNGIASKWGTSVVSGYEYALTVSEVSDTTDYGTYTCDGYMSRNDVDTILCDCGGDGNGLGLGLFNLTFTLSSETTKYRQSWRLMKLP